MSRADPLSPHSAMKSASTKWRTSTGDGARRCPCGLATPPVFDIVRTVDAAGLVRVTWRPRMRLHIVEDDLCWWAVAYQGGILYA